MKAIESRVLVQVDKDTCMQSIGGFKASVETLGYDVAKVVSVGEKVDPSVLKEGDTVYIYSNCGKDFKTRDDHKDYKLISLSEIIVVL